ncbi:MAG: hypothetical protein F6J93_21775 [Oscillatoria sp. SIO1A7]|nr:hypothetical protein [Oscillatoria sp. SIO1A7]
MGFWNAIVWQVTLDKERNKVYNVAQARVIGFKGKVFRASRRSDRLEYSIALEA